MPDKRRIKADFLTGSTTSKNRRVPRALHPHLAHCWHACCCSTLHYAAQAALHIAIPG